MAEVTTMKRSEDTPAGETTGPAHTAGGIVGRGTRQQGLGILSRVGQEADS